VGFAPAYTHKTCVGVIAHSFALGDERLGLLIGKALIDDFQDLPFGHTGILETADLLAGESGQSLNTAVNDVLHGGVGKPDQFQGDGFAAENFDLIGLRHLQDLRIGVTGAREVDGGIGAGEFVIARVRRFHQRQAKVVGGGSMLQLGELRHFHIAGLHGLHFIQCGRPHAGPVERVVIGLRVLLATQKQESTHAGKQEEFPHLSIVRGASVRRGVRACVDTGQTNRWGYRADRIKFPLKWARTR